MIKERKACEVGQALLEVPQRHAGVNVVQKAGYLSRNKPYTNYKAQICNWKAL